MVTTVRMIPTALWTQNDVINLSWSLCLFLERKKSWGRGRGEGGEEADMPQDEKHNVAKLSDCYPPPTPPIHTQLMLVFSVTAMTSLYPE